MPEKSVDRVDCLPRAIQRVCPRVAYTVHGADGISAVGKTAGQRKVHDAGEAAEVWYSASLTRIDNDTGATG